MTNQKSEHDNLLDRIIGMELEMFQAVREEQPSLCKDMPETFKVMRRMTHSVLSNKTLELYLKDLLQATTNRRNLMTEKYARMDSLIPCLNTNPVIEGIVRVEHRWREELANKYPQMFRIQSIQVFDLYLYSELETYSGQTLELYFKDISDAAKEGRNLVEERYTFLSRLLGYNSIDDWVEKQASE